MKHLSLIKNFLPLIIILGMTYSLQAQPCLVESQNLKGEYTGDCKKGKAAGKGKAVGVDSYEGEFKSGLPDGTGIYTYSDGSVYSGKYEKGLKHGKGIMTFKRENSADSIVEGFWKKDIYIGRYEKPYIIHNRSGSIRDIDVEFMADKFYRVKFIITNTSGGMTTTSGVMPRATVTNVQVITGGFDRITNLETHLKATETTLTELLFPFRAKINMGREEFELELLEPGSYILTISLNL